MRMMRSFLGMVLGLAVTLLLCSCTVALPEESSFGTQTGPTVESTQDTALVSFEIHPLPDENVIPVFLMGSKYVPSGDGGYYSMGQKALRYTPNWQDPPVVLCAQPGCKHTDASCHAYLGNARQLGFYRGHCYALVKEEDGSWALVEDGVNGTGRRVIQSWHPEGEEQLEVSCDLLSGGYAYLTVETFEFDETAFTYLISGEKKHQVSLSTGELRELSWEGAIQGGSEEYLITVLREYPEGSLEPLVFSKLQMLAYDLNTGAHRVLYDMDRDGFWASPDPNVCYGNQVVFQRKDTLHAIDIQTLEESELLTMPGIINFWLMDHRVFFITEEQNAGGSVCTVYYADLETHEIIRMENGGNQSYMEFSILQEGNDFFVGNYRGGTRCISKEDFYAENYDGEPG